MDGCEYDGDPDLYGIGIRLGFYLQWVASILAQLLGHPDEMNHIDNARSYVTAATMLAVVIRTSRSTNLDLHITLVLCFGVYYAMVPAAFWTVIATLARLDNLDPAIWYISVSGGRSRYVPVRLLLQIAVVVYQLWFWTTRIYHQSDYECDSFGFLFAKFELRNRAFRSTHLALTCMVAALTVLQATHMILQKLTKSRRLETLPHVQAQRWHRYAWFILQFTIAGTIIVAVELTVSWNNLSNVNDISPAGQLIPLAIGVACLMRVIYVHAMGNLSAD